MGASHPKALFAVCMFVSIHAPETVKCNSVGLMRLLLITHVHSWIRFCFVHVKRLGQMYPWFVRMGVICTKYVDGVWMPSGWDLYGSIFAHDCPVCSV